MSYISIAFIAPDQYQFHFIMEKQYNCLLSTFKIVGTFYENVYSPVLQALPWLDKEDGLKTASEKILVNLAFFAYDVSAYKN